MIELKTANKKIAFTAVMTAITFALNYLYLPFGTYFSISLVPFSCFIAGFVLGAPLAFVSGGLADLIGCFARGYAPNLFILLASALWGAIMGVAYKRIKIKKPYNIIIGAAIGFVVCSLLLNSYGLYSFTSKGSTFSAYVIARAPVQFANLVVNTVLAVLVEKLLCKIYGKQAEEKSQDSGSDETSVADKTDKQANGDNKSL